MSTFPATGDALRRCANRTGWVAWAAICLLVAAACRVDEAGHFESLSGGTYGPDSGGGDVPDEGGAGSDTGDPFPPDENICVFESAGASCSAPVDCCVSDQPPAAVTADACPNSSFPNNWDCTNNTCEHKFDAGANGCNSDTQCADLLPNYICVIDSGAGRCAPARDADDPGDFDECADVHGLPSTFTCETLGGDDFCQHVV